MGFRDLFKKLAGERTHVESAPKPAAVPIPDAQVGQASEAQGANDGMPQVDHAAIPPSASRSGGNDSAPAAALSTARALPPERTETDPMKLAQARLAARRRIRLIVRGISKYGRNGYGGVFKPGESVSFERDPSNPYDSNAVKVLLSDGSMLGFVAREMAATLSGELKEGWRYRVRIAEGPYVEDKWGQCELEVMDKYPPERKIPVPVVAAPVSSAVKPRREGFVPPLSFGDEWRYGKSGAVVVSELEWLYAYYPPRESSENFVIRKESAAAVLEQERLCAGDGKDGHVLRALLAAYAIKDDPAAAEYIRSVGRLAGKCAARCVDDLLPAIADPRIKDFISRCVDMDSVNAVADNCWNVNRAVLDRKVSVLEQLAEIGMVPRLGSFNTMTGTHTDFNIMWTSELHSPLSRAVDRNDLDEARYLISHGADVNQMMFNSGGRGKGSWTLYSKPLLTMVRSVPMYKLFVEAGVMPYPKSYTYRGEERSEGEEHNLLEALWRGDKMDEASLELADYLVFTEYDMSLRGKAEEIRKSCERTDGGCPYKQNMQYVLEWCDMEKRAVKELAERLDWDVGDEGPYLVDYFDQLLHAFGDVWVYEGYDEAVRAYRHEFEGTDDLPPRYVYPERILKRGFQHGVP